MKILITKTLILAFVVLFYANTLFAQYSNATLNGPWRWHSVPFNTHPDSASCLVFDGNGNITDVLAFFFSELGSTYSVSSSGVFSGSFNLHNSLTSFTGQLTSSKNVTFTISDYNFTGSFSRITNPGALTDTLIGVLNSTNYGQKNITIVLNSQGQVISSKGLTTPVSGGVYADSGMFVGHIRTGDPNEWKGITITGTYTNDSLNGMLSVEAPRESRYGTVQLTRTGNVTPVSVRPINTSNPAFFGLNQNYPNPFNPVTMINYQLPMNSYVTLKVYDVLGREIALLVNEIKDAGTYSVKFDGSKLSSGVYFYTLHSGIFTATKKLSLLK